MEVKNVSRDTGSVDPLGKIARRKLLILKIVSGGQMLDLHVQTVGLGVGVHTKLC